MRTALDSSVLLLIQKRQSGWETWRDKLSKAALEGQLVMCPVVFAECSAGYPDWETAFSVFSGLQIHFDPISPDSAYLAGRILVQYRKEGGRREHLIPDFLIAAHAHCQADRLAALDRGYFRRYFPDLSGL